MVLNVADALAAYSKNSSGSISPINSSLAESGSNGGSFADTLKSFANEAVNEMNEGEKAATAGATGKADLAGVVTAIGNAELMLQTVVTIRDKVLAAYQDITKTAI